MRASFLPEIFLSPLGDADRDPARRAKAMLAGITEAERQQLVDDALWEEATAVIFPGSSENASREHSKNVSHDVSSNVSRDDSPETLHRGPPDRSWGSPKGSSPNGSFRRPIQLPAHELRRQSIHLAQGGFGHVFRVERLPSLPSAGPVAVKQLKPGSTGEDEATREVALLSCCRHKHILPLLGYTALKASCVPRPHPPPFHPLSAVRPFPASPLYPPFPTSPPSPQKVSPICFVYPLMTGGTLEDRVLLPPEAWPRLQALVHRRCIADAP